MPKSAKKRKDKAADFAKAKLKLGKGKQQPSNAIDTSFKARSIALPSQSIAKHLNTEVPTTKRRLSFEDLILHLKHYSASTRKDALAGLRELLDAHPHILHGSLPTLIAATARVIGDEDAGVRKSLLEFYTWLFPRVPADDLMPHTPTLLLFTTSAQTHIFPEIRVDAIRFLDIYLEHMPSAIVAGWDREGTTGHQVLQGYLGLLNAGTSFGDVEGPMRATSIASVVLTAASKLVVLQSLSTLLRHSTSNSTTGVSSTLDTWYLRPWFTTDVAYTTFDDLLRPRLTTPTEPSIRSWRPEADFEEEDDVGVHTLVQPIGSIWSLEELSHIPEKSEEIDTEGSSIFLAHLVRTLHSTLVSTFLDCAPAVFSPNGRADETQSKLILSVVEIARHLYGPLLRSSSATLTERNARASEDLKSVLGYMSPYFPFTTDSRDIQTEQTFQALNLIYCELSSLVMLPSTNRPTKKAGQSKGNLRQQTERVSTYVTRLLKGENMSPSQIGRPLTADAYNLLLPTIWALMNNPDPQSHDLSRGVLLAVIDHGRRVSSKSAVKQYTLEFISRVLLLDTETQFTGHIGAEIKTAEEVSEWINHLPKCLWELGSSNLVASEVILRFLIAVSQRRSRIVNNEVARLLRSQLVPYFTMTHPSRGQISGPYSKLPTSGLLRRLVLSLIVLIRSKDDSALSSAVDSAVTGSEEASYWSSISNYQP
ncbi:Ipi1-N domain-containing protein [Mycena indigotica]|uniref:Pre-rRNA-processing protein n=1 Tax=Mycena indigotica TaxID=2126181 RepID=A0A8H6SXM2_9AGAR|nr:Ipi1-N domain-containing protein [Mycena indigotica]KAF7307005.1 Ipi1-N domain-containing protein [Mycena indigotica]